ncbi:MAG: urease accessory protein [Alphaproteobacteria bacterium]|nr:MAG: urease accessory protein [Alphaproteobacteria bacterium]
MLSFLALGFLIGMQHALEADHVAAVASLASGERSLRAIVRHGTAWGIGHATSLFVFAGIAIVLGIGLPARTAAALELAVGVMLVGLGLDVFRRLVRARVHFHAHAHTDGVVHIHAHSHDGDTGPHDPTRHEHTHPPGLPVRTFAVGLMHGLAGSAALLLLAVTGLRSGWSGLVYVAIFGAGSIVGMALLSAAMAIPLSFTARAMTWAHRGLQIATGSLTVIIGGFIVVEAAGTLL